MNKKAFALAAVMFGAVWLILFISAVTAKDVNYLLWVLAILAGALAVTLAVVAIAENEFEKRPPATLINRRYERLKQNTADCLKTIYFDPVKQMDYNANLRKWFLAAGEELGIERKTLMKDWKRLNENRNNENKN